MGSRRTGLDQAVAEDVLAKACAVAALDPAGAELVRLGSAAVFRLRTRPVIVRVGHDGSGMQVADLEVRVARWLSREGVPATRALRVDQPLEVDNHVVTFWESAADVVRYGSSGDLGGLLVQLHALAPPADPRLPEVDPFGPAAARVGSAETLEDRDRVFLLGRLEELAAAYGDLRFSLPGGVIHGDATVGNVLLDRQGAPLLVDLDGVAVGPREWDLVPTALYYDRFSWHTAEQYAAFVDIMGFDVTTWPGYEVFADLRECLMVVWLAHTATDEKKRAELAKRLASLRTGESRRNWSPF